MKKMVALMAVLALSVTTLFGCGSKPAESTAAPADSSAPAESSAESSSESDTSADTAKVDASDLKIAIVCDSAGQHDNGYNQKAVEGAVEMADTYGVEYKVVEPTESIGQTMSVLADDGYNLIFNMAYDFDALINGEAGGDPIAEMYPDTTFVVFNATPNIDEAGNTIHDNVISVLYNVNESSYIAGALYVLVNENADVLFGDGYDFVSPDESRAFGFIGGSDSDGITVFSVGYIEGVQKMAEELGVTYDYYEKLDAGFADAATGSTVAGTYFDQGANVVYGCAGVVGDGITAKAKEKGRLAIQVDANKDDQQPGYVLTSVIKNTNVVVKSLTEAYLDGTLNDVDRTSVYDLASGATSITDLATISEYINTDDAAQAKWTEIKDKIADLEAQISDGSIVVTNKQNGDDFDPASCPNIKFN